MPRSLLLNEDGSDLLSEDSSRLLQEDSENFFLPGQLAYVGGIPNDDIQAYMLGPSAVVTRRCEILNSDASLWLPDAELLPNGNVSCDISRDERRAVDATFRYSSALPMGVGGLWYDKLIRIWRGVDAGALGTWEIPLGTFMIDKIDHDLIANTVHVTGRDLSKRLITSATPDAVTFVAGTNAIDIIRAEAAIAGITNMVLPTDAFPLTADLTFDADTTRMDMIKALTTPFNLEAFFDTYGYLIVRTLQDPFLSASTFTFRTGQTVGNISTLTKTIDDSLLYNHVIVRGESDSVAIPAQAEVVITDPLSPIHPDKIGDRTYPFTSPLVTTDDQALTLAQSLQKVFALEQFQVQVDAIAIPWLEGGNVVTFLDPDPMNASDPTRYLVQNFTINLDASPMSLQIGRVVTLL